MLQLSKKYDNYYWNGNERVRSRDTPAFVTALLPGIGFGGLGFGS